MSFLTKLCTVGVCALAALGTGPPALAQNPAATVTVDVTQNRRAIDPRIYGVNLADKAALADLNAPINRRGGNHTSRYNWQLNADNRAFDWYFESLGYAATPGELGDTFITDSRSAGAEPMLTLPMMDWVARLGPNRERLSSFSIQKYGPQTGRDSAWFPDAGNGISAATGQPITTNDPNDANTPNTSAFQMGWVDHLLNKWGPAANGGVRYYLYDNEPSIWYATHRDVAKTGLKMDDHLAKILDYGAKVRAKDPNAVLVGPEEWGWTGFFLSGYDQQYASIHGWGGGWASLPDRIAHGQADYHPWLLQQLKKHQDQTGKRLLDVYTVHYYPQSGEYSDVISQEMQLRRNRSTRALWDPNYTDESWISAKVQLVPRIRGWVDQYYPGTQTGITEYSWGADGHINGATAQADVLGIFGREGLNLATRWTTPAANTPTYKAMKLFRNYDGKKSTFGDVSVKATGPDPDGTAVFAAERTKDGALTVMVINKVLSGSTPVNMSVAGFTGIGKAEAWQITTANRIARLPDLDLSGNTLSAAVPAQSITLFVLPKTGSTSPPPPDSGPSDPPAGAGFASSVGVNPATVTVGGTVSVFAHVSAVDAYPNGVVDVEITSAAGAKVFQKTWPGQSFAAGENKDFGFNWTAPATDGVYTVKVGVFSADWSQNPHWNNDAATVTVTPSTTPPPGGGGTPPDSSTGGGFTTGATANPSTVAGGAALTLNASVKSVNAFPNGIVDVEVYSAAGARVFQKTWSGQTFAAGETKTYATPWTAPNEAGTYTVKVGVFAENWSGNPHWNYNAATLTVTAGTPPPTGPSFTSTATATPSEVAPGGSANLSAKVTNTGGAFSNGIVDLEVYSPAGARVFQKTWPGQSFTAGQSLTFDTAWVAPAEAGTYAVKVGVFAGDGSSNPHWNPQAATVTVLPGPPPAPTFTAKVSVNPNPVQAGWGASVFTTVTASGVAVSNATVEVEIANPAGAKVDSRAWTGQSFAAGQFRDYGFTWTAPMTPGAYTVKVSVYNADRSKRYLAADAATVTVQGDASQFGFEIGTQNWTHNGAPISYVYGTNEQKFAGSRSLGVRISGGAGTKAAYATNVAVPAGRTVTFRVWVPSGSPVRSVQAFALEGASRNWRWTGAVRSIGQLTPNAWNAITLALPADVNAPLDKLGVEFATGGSWTGTCYIDSVQW